MSTIDYPIVHELGRVALLDSGKTTAYDMCVSDPEMSIDWRDWEFLGFGVVYAIGGRRVYEEKRYRFFRRAK
jgi:hypothetical protein